MFALVRSVTDRIDVQERDGPRRAQRGRFPEAAAQRQARDSC
jgi:hypothetical protein